MRDWHPLGIAASLAWAAEVMKTNETAGGDAGGFPVAQCATGKSGFGRGWRRAAPNRAFVATQLGARYAGKELRVALGGI